ncbi:MAG: TolC family protein, partial [Ottowia sp.]|nr:TolC family protein [Ottowia sp.]
TVKGCTTSGEALGALVEWRSASQAATIAQAQREQLNTLLELVEKRQQAGDLGSIDAELTFLSLSQQLAQVAEVEATLQKAESRVRELLPQWTPERGGIPEDFWPSRPGSTTDQELLKHPAVASAQARWQSLKEEAEVTRRSAKAEPTVGINAGRDGGENLVGVTFSIPLNVRNNFSAETRAAERAALEAEARFQAVYRKQRFDWQAAQAAWQRFDQQYRSWKTLVHGRVENSAKLLERQWRSGDLSTTDYLLALNQRAESLLAGIALEKQARLTLTDVLLQSGRLATATMPTTLPTN